MVITDTTVTTKSHCAVVAAPGFEAKAQQLAGQLELPFINRPCVEKPPAEAAFLCLLLVNESGLGIQLTGASAPGAVRCEFASGALAHRRKYGGGKKQDLPRAIGLDRRADLRVLDMTAGLGRDAFVLASLGASVTMMERNPVVHALLADGLQRAREYGEESDPQLLDIIQRMTLYGGDATELFDVSSGELPDVIYLDPMFPARQKSAKVKKEMQAFHVLVGDDADADQLLPAAIEQARFRVVVKRPVHAPLLAGMTPGHSLSGKSTRYDIYSKQKIV